MRIILAIDDSQFSADAVREVAAMPWPPDTTVRALTQLSAMLHVRSRSYASEPRNTLECVELHG
jgi:hypothetical protein